MLLNGVTVPYASSKRALATFQGHYSQNATTVSVATGSGVRKIVISTFSAGAALTGITIGGNAMTQIGSTLGSTEHHQTWYYDDTTGAVASTANAVISGASYAGLGVWSVSGAVAGAPTYSNQQSGAPGNITFTISCDANGCIIASAGARVNTSLACTWTTLTKEWDNEDVYSGSGNGDTHTGADAFFSTAQSGISVSCSTNGGSLVRGFYGTAMGFSAA